MALTPGQADSPFNTGPWELRLITTLIHVTRTPGHCLARAVAPPAERYRPVAMRTDGSDTAAASAAVAPNRKRAALVAGAVVAGVLAVGGWSGYRYLDGQTATGCSLRSYDPHDVASTARYAEDVFTGRVAAFVERRDVDGWAEDVYRVEVVSVVKGTPHGTVRITYGLDEGVAGRLKDGSTYVFATRARSDTVTDGRAQLYQGEMKPVDDAQLAVWKKAAALPVAPE